MGSLFEIAKSGIQAYRQALSVTGQNITNVNTEGYSKRDVSLQEIGGIQGGVTDVSDQSGLGVSVDEISSSFNASICLFYTSPSPRDGLLSRMPSSA